MLRCQYCGKSADEAGVLFRTNPKGERGQWGCAGCLPPEHVDQEVAEITAFIESIDQTHH